MFFLHEPVEAAQDAIPELGEYLCGTSVIVRSVLISQVHCADGKKTVAQSSSSDHGPRARAADEH